MRARQLAPAIAWLALGCGGTPEGADPAGARRIAQRLVDVSAQAGDAATPRASELPTATIRDDTRYVLASHPESVLAYGAEVDPEREGLAVFTTALGPRLPDAEWLFVAPVVQPAGESAWQRLPGALLRLRHEQGQRLARVPLALPGARPGAPLKLTLVAFAPPPGGTRHATPPVAIPAGARLEFAFGVLEVAAGQGPVRFGLSACRASECEPLFAETLDPSGPEPPAWQDRRVSLAPLAGERVSLRFEAEPVAPGARSLPVWANPTVVSAAPAGERPPPNVVLLSIDTLRRDHLDLYGYARETAPFLRSQLAREGVVLENLVSEASTTDPSHMTLFTSLPALVHGARCCLQRLSAPVRPLAEIVRCHGWATAAFTENGPLAAESGFAIGFDAWVENKSAQFLEPSGQVERTFRQARDWLDRHADRPFFLFLHTFQVHAPYRPPRAYRDHFGPLPADSSERQRKLVNYDREIRFVDDELRELRAWTAARGLDDNTLWFVLSDHGEEFLEHGSYGHGTLPYEEVLRVPLVVAGPGIARGVRSQAPLHHVDVAPTILELLGIPAPPHVWGQSFAGLLRTGKAPAGDERPRFSASWILPDGLEAPALAVQVGRRKLIRYRDADGLQLRYFDLESDPHERSDLSGTRAGEASELAALLAGYLERARLAAESLSSAGPDAAGEPAPPDPLRENELRALGYIE